MNKLSTLAALVIFYLAARKYPVETFAIVAGILVTAVTAFVMLTKNKKQEPMAKIVKNETLDQLLAMVNLDLRAVTAAENPEKANLCHSLFKKERHGYNLVFPVAFLGLKPEELAGCALAAQVCLEWPNPGSVRIQNNCLVVHLPAP